MTTGQKRPKRKTSANQRIWMRLAQQSDADELRALIEAQGEKWRQFEYKLHRGNILIYSPVTPYHWETRRHDPALRYLALQLRICPAGVCVFQLEYMRHTGQWWPLGGCRGDISDMAGFITDDGQPVCQPPGSRVLQKTESQ